MEVNNRLIASDVVQRFEEIRFKSSISWQIRAGEQWAIVGPNGAGKTLLIDTLVGKYALKSGKIICLGSQEEEIKQSEYVKIVSFRDIYSLTETRDAFYQQRWNAGIMQDESPASSLLPKNSRTEWGNYLIGHFGIENLLEKDIRLLSSGELRKFIIVKALLSQPKVLILDNPYIGLDTASREILNSLLQKIVDAGDTQVVLVLADPSDIPPMITHILPIKNRNLEIPACRTSFLSDFSLQEQLFPKTYPKAERFRLAINPPSKTDEILRMEDIHVAYGHQTILDGFNWKIMKGEKWALLGANGSGKSTLLSLISGDNPQAYANKIHLFGKKRGTGESIWDIKKRIGYISPEMHLHYQKNIPCIDIVGSGFFDTVGLYIRCNEDQRRVALEWMKKFGIAHLKGVSFLQVSSGEQRLVLLCRVFVKNPDLLILDEPFHGLDATNKEKVKNIIENFCTQEKSLIFVTHYDDEIPKVVNKRIVLSRR